MTEQISTIADTRRRATNAWHAGRTIADVGPNWHSPAYAVWEQVYAELDAQKKANAELEQAA